MTPQERQLIAELFDRLATLENAPRDPDAEAMIREGFRRAPNAAYALVQTVLVQDEALKAANNRIQEYEQQFGAPQPRREPRGFLDSMRDSLFGRDEPRGSVPRVPQGGAYAPSGAPMGAPPGYGGDPWARRRRAMAGTGLWPAGRADAGRADAGAAAAGWRRRLVPRHRGGGRGRRDRRLAADGRHPLRDGRPPGRRAGVEGLRGLGRRRSRELALERRRRRRSGARSRSRRYPRRPLGRWRRR